jgi:xanthine dehydrogenase accessory factor
VSAGAAAKEPHDPDCEVAHGEVEPPAVDGRVLVAVYSTPLASVLLRWAAELGFSTVLVEPDLDEVDDVHRTAAGRIVGDPAEAGVTPTADVVVTDHHRDDLGQTMAPLLIAQPRWIGIIGSPRHVPPHVEALRAQGVPDALIERVQRPIGIDIGSRTPPEIGLSVLAGLLADRNERPLAASR